MPAVRKLPPLKKLVELAERDGLTNQQIADRYGTTSEAVRQAFAKADIHRTPARPSHARFLPWRIRADHVSDILARRLRTYSRIEQGLDVNETDRRLTEEWVKFMEGNNSYGLPLSVHYNRNDPDGFWLEPRQEGDRDFISP